ncbi:MAG: flagellar assembly protein FliX [Alphaproteobacteria bacterium]|nr:flagellar assembly protein FliX [Alphaproteobacteria bacterium]
MKVTGYGTIKPTTSLRKRDGTSAANFSDFLGVAESDAAASVVNISETAATATIGSLLALQEISEEERKRERLVKQGKTMLDALERLRQQLLIGEIPAQMLPELASSMAAQKEAVSDPYLLELIEDIELRVAVELAKLEMAFAARAEI